VRDFNGAANGSLNPYVVAQLGGATREVPLGDAHGPYMSVGVGATQRLVSQPVVGGEVREWYDDKTGVKRSELKLSPDRFLVFLHGSAQVRHLSFELRALPRQRSDVPLLRPNG
jgi:hypothetical protein